MRASQFQGMHSSFIATKSDRDFSQITVLSPDGKPVMKASVVLTDNKGNLIFNTFTNENGIAKIKNVKDKAVQLTISLLGYDKFMVSFQDSFDYSVTLMDYIIL